MLETYGITTTTSSSPPPPQASSSSERRLEPLGCAVAAEKSDASDSYSRALEYADMDSSCERCKGAGDSPAVAVSHEMKVVARDASAGDDDSNKDTTTGKPSPFASNLKCGKSDDEEGAEGRRARTLSTSSNDGYQLSQEIMQKDYYFNHIGSSQRVCDKTYTNQTVLDLELDKRMPMIVLRKNLARLLNRSSREICLYKICLSKQEIEMSKPLDDLRLVPDHQEYLVKYGRALKKDEYRCKVYLLQSNDAEPSKLLIDFVVQHGKTVLKTKEELCQELTENTPLDVTPDRLRLRKKTYKAPDRIYLDSEVFGTDIHCHASLDFYIQLLSEPETKVSKKHQVVMCKRWRPSQLRFDDYFELTIDTSSCESRWASLHLLRTKLAAETGKKEDEDEIALDRIAVAKARTGTFPYAVHPLEVDTEMEWCFAQSPTAPSFTPSIDDGSVFFFKDSHEKKKELSESERNSLMGGSDQPVGIDNLISIGEENNDNNNVASTSSAQQQRPSNNSNYRREKALKIYTVDTQPKKNTRFAL